MDRALREFRIRGVATNLAFLENVIGHPSFRDLSYTTRFIDETPALTAAVRRRDRATKLLNYIADVTVNGHPETRGRPRPDPPAPAPVVPVFDGTPADGTKQRLDRDGPESFARWMRDERRVLVTDTTMRDAHQSLLATRMRSYDIVAVAEAYATALPELLSLECWGGATFDVAMRFLTEDPWERLATIRESVPNILLQMLLRGANGVGYTNYPDNVVRFFVREAAAAGIDLFRVFDCLNWPENMRVAMDAVLRGAESSARRRSAIRATSSTRRGAKYDLALLRRARPRAGEGGRAHHRGEGHGRRDEAGGGARALQGARRGGRRADPFPHARHVRARRRDGAGGGRIGRGGDRRGDGFALRAHLAAVPRLARRRARPDGAGDRPRPRGDPKDLALLGGGALPVPPPSRATCAPAPRRSTCTRCRAASSPI